MNLKELAAHLRLSPTTVSRALNGYPEVSEATRTRVREAAEALNYRPRHHARQLATGRSMVLGHVVTRSRHALIAPLFADLMAGAGAAADALGYDTHVRIVDDADEDRHYRDLAASRRVDGVIVHGPLEHDPRIPLLAGLELPFIVHGRNESGPPHAWLDVDNARAIERATALLLDLGHADIGFVNGPEELHFARCRRDGFVTAHRTRGLAPDPARMFAGPLVEHRGHDAAVAMLDAPTPPTAMVCSGLLPAWGALRAVLTRGLSPGSDLSIVAYDDGVSWLSNRGDGDGTEPLFTTVRGSIHEAGHRLVAHLVRLVEEPGAPLPAETLPTELVLGRSTAARGSGRSPDASPDRPVDRSAGHSLRRTADRSR